VTVLALLDFPGPAREIRQVARLAQILPNSAKFCHQSGIPMPGMEIRYWLACY
jgi:hypothetical protein